MIHSLKIAADCCVVTTFNARTNKLVRFFKESFAILTRFFKLQSSSMPDTSLRLSSIGIATGN